VSACSAGVAIASIGGIVACQSSTANLELRAGAVVAAAPG